MLRLTPIRTKLWIAMSLLSVVLLLLASSGLWGLYRYKQLAGEIGDQSQRIPQASQLNSLAMVLRESHIRSNRLRDRGGMLGSAMLDPLFEIESFERQTFDSTLVLIRSLLDRIHQAQPSETSRAVTHGMLVDHRKQTATLKNIATRVDAISNTNRPMRPIDDTDYKVMLEHLDKLVAKTDELATCLHESMAKFSDAVRVEYRGLIVLAWFASLMAVALITILLLAFRSYVVKPFRTLLLGARLVEHGQYEHQIELGTGDELSDLARAINGMTTHFRTMMHNMDAEIRTRTRELVRSEQLASVGFLAAGVAHEINNPLAAVAWSAESLQNQIQGATIIGTEDDSADEPLAEELQNGLSRIESEAYRCKGIIEKLLDFSRLGETRRDDHDLRAMVDDVVDMVGKVGKYRCMNITVSGDNEASACINPQEIRQVILNLLTNALESVDGDGRVDVAISSARDRVVVIVEDNGCGMTDEVREHLFEPFFTRRRDGGGTGLGLSITWRIVNGHGGTLQATSAGPGSGSQFRLELPKAAEDHCGWSAATSVHGTTAATESAVLFAA